MTEIKREITHDEVKRAKGNPFKLIPESIVMGYGVYGARIKQENGKYYLEYERGDSCD